MKCLQVLILGVTLFASVKSQTTPPLKCFDSTLTTADNLKDCAATEKNCATIFEFKDGVTTGPVVAAKGCYTDLKTKCDADSMLCKICSTGECNTAVEKMDQIDCISCTATDPKCVKSVGDFTTTTKGYLCSTAAIDQTPTAADAAKVYHNSRGPVNTKADYDACKTPGGKNKCTLCNESKCNKDVLPERATCGASELCLKPVDTCVAFYDNKGKKEKEGCRNEKEADCAEVNCVDCGKEACADNIKNMCYECTKTGTEDCVTKKIDQIKACTTGNCITTIEGDTFSRGCATADSKDTHKSVVCTGVLCNNQEIKDSKLKCYQCDDKNEKCGLKLDTTLETTVCKSKTFEGLDEECYEFKKEIKRGCLSSLFTDTANYEICLNNKEECETCKGDGCNKDDINGSATVTGAFLLITVTALTALLNN